MQQLRIVVLSPPFYSHFGPLMALSRALQDAGADVVVACSRDFESEIRRHALGFAEVQINRNANTGQTAATRQAEEEQQRLREFFDATYRGPIDTLRTQTRHRFADMLANPEELLQRIAELQSRLQPQLWIVDQLSYGATLALTAHGLRFVTFCPPHPLSIPAPDAVYGVPPHWPQPFSIDAQQLSLLQSEARELQQRFTQRFNQLLAPYGKQVADAFALTSEDLIVHNYPEFERTREPAAQRTTRLYCGYCFVPEKDKAAESAGAPGGTLGAAAAGSAESFREPQQIVIALGTFLAARSDVLITLGRQLRKRYPRAHIAIGAGEDADTVHRAVQQPTLVQPFIPQRQLLRRADLFIHHGGVSSFTESIYFGVPMIVLPFSSDQFNVAADVECSRIGAVLDPNNLSPQQLDSAIVRALSAESRQALSRFTHQLRSRGPAWAAAAVMALLRAEQATPRSHGQR